jgi:Tol biopolymer transport system component
MSEYTKLFERAGAGYEPPSLSTDGLLRRRDRKRRNQRIRAGVLGLVLAIAVGWLGINAIRSTPPAPADPPDDRSEDLGIFEPVAGRIVYGNPLGIWGVDPAAPADPATTVKLTSEAGIPLGWSSDGTRLLIMRCHQRGGGQHGLQGPKCAQHLFVLHADGSETQVTTDPIDINGATISPDGSRVVFAGRTGQVPGGAEGDCCTRSGVFAVDADGGPPEVLVQSQDGVVEEATFSPDGTRIAYVHGSGDHSHHVWVMGADGSDAREIVFNEWTAGAGHVRGLAWSPAGDRIALGLEGTTYTFAPDGSGFTQVISRGDSPYWSPDGSQIAYTLRWPYTETLRGALAIADADGSNDREFGLAMSGPWHPGTSVVDASPSAVTQPSPAPTPADPPNPAPTPAALGGLAYALDGDIYVADPDGSNATRIADGLPAEDCALGEYWAEGSIWSPDGRYLAYRYSDCSSADEFRWGGVVISDPEGNVLATFPSEGWKIAWSPDSTRVAVWDRLFETIGVYGVDGARQMQLTMPPGWEPSGDHDPVWMPDGTSLMVDDVEVPLDGGAPRE